MEIFNRLVELQDKCRDYFGNPPSDKAWVKIPFVGRYTEQHKDKRLFVLPALLFDVEDLYFERITKEDMRVRGYFTARLYVSHEHSSEKWDEGPVKSVALLDEVLDFFRNLNSSASFCKPYSVTRFHEIWGSSTNEARGGTLKVREYDIWIIKLEVLWREKINSGGSLAYSLPIGEAVIGTNFVVGGNIFVTETANLGYASALCVDALTSNGLSVCGLDLDSSNSQLIIKIKNNNE